MQDHLKNALVAHIRLRGAGIVKDGQQDSTGQKDKTMVTDLLKLKSRMDRVLAGPFAPTKSKFSTHRGQATDHRGKGSGKGDSDNLNMEFVYAVKAAFEFCINCRQNRPAEMIAKFIDATLRSGTKGGTEAERESLLDRVMVLFRFINGKDVFEAFYKKDLAKRLLLRKSAR
jgi:cullin-4